MSRTTFQESSISSAIEKICTPNEKEKGKFICPVCEGHNLQISRDGKWNCWNDPSPEHRSAIALALLDKEQSSTNRRSRPIKSSRQRKRELDKSRDALAAVALSEVEMKVEELVLTFDPSFGLTKAKLLAEMASWAKVHGHDVYAAKMLLSDRLKQNRADGANTDDQCKLAKNYTKISDLWEGKLKLNERTYDIELNGEPLDLTIARVNLAVEKNISVGVEDFESIAYALAKQEAYDPVAQYLERVASQYRDTDIIEGMAERYFGAKGTIYQAFIRKTLIAAVARVFNPGCMVHTVLILQGQKQGQFKSSFFKMLAGSEWFDDTMGNASDKDERLKLQRFWLIEWPELETIFKKKDVSAVKAFITNSSDNLRPPYGRRIETLKRRSIIVGTTNEDDFLRDPTGNRRFWIVPIRKPIPLMLLQEERDRIWAAAVHLYRQGEPWHLEGEESDRASEVASNFEDQDPWQEYIEEWLELTDRGQYTTNEILEKVFHLQPSEIDRKQQMRISYCMKKLGWEQAMKGKTRRRFWLKKDKFSPQEVDQVDLPLLESLSDKGLSGDRRGEQKVDQRVDQPRCFVPDKTSHKGDRPQKGRSTSKGGVDRPVDHPSNPPGERISGEVDQPQARKSLKGKILNFESGEKLRSGWETGSQRFSCASILI
jgi:predicted P-loop ATPase